MRERKEGEKRGKEERWRRDGEEMEERCRGREGEGEGEGDLYTLNDFTTRVTAFPVNPCRCSSPAVGLARSSGGIGSRGGRPLPTST